MKVLIILLLFGVCSAARKCVPRDFKKGSVVCVCTEKYCDDIDPLLKTDKGIAQVYVSTKDGKRFERTLSKFNHLKLANPANLTLTVDRTKTFQKILGFGGAFTDTAVIEIAKMNPKIQTLIYEDYFGSRGIEYNLGRTTIAGSDFSVRNYTYDDYENDFNLTKFALQEEDLKYRIPQMKLALKVAANKKNIKWFGSPWSGPAWLKTSHKLNGNGTLIGKAGSKWWKTYATYLLKWLQTHRALGIEFWGMTVQNEPNTGFEPNFPWNTMGFTPEMQRDFVKVDLGPLLESNGWTPKNFSIMIWDHNRDQLPQWVDPILNDPDAAKYVAGVAFHWYLNNDKVHAGPERLDQTHFHHPKYFLLNTEACNDGQDLSLGNWEFGENYARDIIIDLNHWSVGWVDWNFVTDLHGGPNWVRNFHPAPIMVNNTRPDEYYKNPMFYALGHFSKFLVPESVRVGLNLNGLSEKFRVNNLVEASAFLRPDGGLVVNVINLSNEKLNVDLNDNQMDGKLSLTVEKRSFNTWLYY